MNRVECVATAPSGCQCYDPLLMGLEQITTLVVVVGSVLLASISWFLFERRCNALKRYVDYVPNAGPMSSHPRAERREGPEVRVQI